jgi:hypothetical protein
MALDVWNKGSQGWGEFKVWPLSTKHPTTDSSRQDFFDTMYHSTLIAGLNTSAMVEAAIIGKPVFTFTEHGAASSQTGNLHFDYLVKSGFVSVSGCLAEHVDDLANGVGQGVGARRDACESFVKRFIRPLGLDVNASKTIAGRIHEEVLKVRSNRAME